MIPHVLVAALVGIVLAGAGGFWKGWLVGRESREGEVIELRAQIGAAEAAANAAKEAANAAGKRAAQRVVERIRVVEAEAAQTPQIIERVVRETPADCRLPPAFRSLWDGPSSETLLYRPSGADVSAADLAEATVEARKRFAENAARLESLQQYVKELSGNNQ